MRFRAICAFHAHDQQRIDALTETALFMIIVEDTRTRQPNEVWMGNLELASIGEMKRERPEWSHLRQLSNLLEHETSVRSIACENK